MLDLSLQQKQTLSVFQVQSLSILTASVPELMRIIEEHANSNPLMTVRRGPGSLRDVKYVGRAAEQASENYEEYLNSIPEKEDDIRKHLLKQVPYLDLNQKESEMCELIISGLDNRGFLMCGAEDILETFDAGEDDRMELYERMRDLLSSLDPVGCAAYDVYDSLRRQLEARKGAFIREGLKEDSMELASRMINESDFLVFSKKGIGALASKYGVGEEKAAEAFGIVKRLDPNPARDYDSASFKYVIPAISVSIEDNEVHVSVRDDALPAISIDDSYDGIELDGKSRRFIDNCRKDASLLISMIDSRNRTLSSIAYFMVNKQLNWLVGKTNCKVPLMLKDVALYADVSISTASRIVSSNYLQYGGRCISLSDLMERSFDGSNSKSDVMNAISEIMASSAKKLSDEKIRGILEERGISISRRTVQKYRTAYANSANSGSAGS